MDPAALVSLFALPCAVAVACAMIPSVRESSVHRDGWRPSVEPRQFTAIPSVSPRRASLVAQPAAPPAVASARSAAVAAPNVARAAPSVRSGAVVSEESSLHGLGFEDTWTWDEAAFRAWWEQRRAWYEAYWARQRWARVAPALARLYTMRAGMFDALQSAGAFDPSLFERPTDCGPFECGASATYVPPSTSPRSSGAPRATAQRAGSRWTLSNGRVSLSIDVARACRVDYSLPTRAPSSVVIDTPRSDDRPATCTARALPWAGGAAIELSWVSERWTQQAVISLADDASLAQSTLARNTLGADGVSTLEFTNLTPSPRVWTIGGRDLSVDPGGMLRVRTPSPDAS
ncbi:MAG: hypothetical protein U0269_28210 [Polyangiales bacterium]